MADRGRSSGAGRIRLVDVAALAGVTKSVASRVLNGDPTLSVRPETRQRVLAAAERLGYRPHAGARALAGAQARTLALLVPDAGEPVDARIIHGVSQRARHHGYVVLLADDPADDQTEESLAELVESGRVDGLLILSARHGHRVLESDRLSRVPYVFVDCEAPGSERTAGLASAAAVDHLYELGHRRIGQVSARRPEDGFSRRLAEYGLDAGWIEHDEVSEQGGARATERLLARCPDLTAVYAGALSQAVGVLHTLRTLARSVPDDVSVITSDDLPLAGLLDPPLTTVALPLTELGASAVDAVVAQLTGRPADSAVEREPHLILRQSTAKRSGNI